MEDRGVERKLKQSEARKVVVLTSCRDQALSFLRLVLPPRTFQDCMAFAQGCQIFKRFEKGKAEVGIREELDLPGSIKGLNAKQLRA